MPPLPTHSLRAIRGLPADCALCLQALSRAITHPLALTPLKLTDSVAVYAAQLNNQPIILKCWPLSGLRTRAYAALRSSRASRQWRGSQRLASLGIPTPHMLALIRGKAPTGQAVELLIMQHVPGDTVLQHMATAMLPTRTQHRLAEALALQCFQMAAAGVFNRDHKPSNLIIRSATSDSADIVVLDAVAIRPIAWGDLTLSRLPLERLILEAIGVNATPRRALIARFIRRWTDLIHTSPPDAAAFTDPRAADDARRELKAARRRVWQTVHARILAHGDPTPTDNPLSPIVD